MYLWLARLTGFAGLGIFAALAGLAAVVASIGPFVQALCARAWLQ